MNFDPEELLEQIRRDYPTQYEMSSLRLLVDKQAQEIDRLNAHQTPPNFEPFGGVYQSATTPQNQGVDR